MMTRAEGKQNISGRTSCLKLLEQEGTWPLLGTERVHCDWKKKKVFKKIKNRVSSVVQEAGTGQNEARDHVTGFDFCVKILWKPLENL